MLMGVWGLGGLYCVWGGGDKCFMRGCKGAWEYGV